MSGAGIDGRRVERAARTKTAEERIGRIKSLMVAIYCTANGDTRRDDPGNRNSITWLVLIAEEELRHLEGGIDARAANLSCGA